MEDNKSELLQYAREYAAANQDLYELLAVSPNATQPEVHRAWRKASLKHHPDKARVFDPELWQLFERARDVLSAPEARAAYDSARAAALQARKAREALDAKKRAMIDDLEARERGVKRKVGDDEYGDGNGARMMTASEKRVLMERGREYLEKRQRMREEAEARERERERERERARERMEESGADRNDTMRKEAEPRSTQPDSARPPAPTTTTTGAASTTTSTATGMEGPGARPSADEYDERIADLERRLRERKADKAARKAEKKNKARKEKDDPPPVDEDGVKPTFIPPVATTATPPPSTTTITTATTTTTDKPSSQSKPPIPTSRISTSAAAASGDFSSTMAKLRAAQREKERKRAEAAAAMASDG